MGLDLHLVRSVFLVIRATLSTIADFRSSARHSFNREGLLTVFAGVLAVFVIADYPATCKWLTAEEREWVAFRLATDGSSVGEGHEVKMK